MIVKKLTLNDSAYPQVLRELAQPPKQLYIAGAPLETALKRPCVAIVGSRKITPYGKQVTSALAKALAERGIVIISGLALGVDAWGQQAAIEAGGHVMAVLPSPVEQIVPVINRGLARRILEQGGSLISEYVSGEPPFKQNFIARNRVVAGLADAVLITEAAEKSGSLHTARFALEQGKEVLAVPGNVTMPNSVGTNNLIKRGATPVTSYKDVLHALGLEDRTSAARLVRGHNAHEQAILSLMEHGVSDGSELLEESKLAVSAFNQALTMLEIGGKIVPLGANHWAPS